MDRHHDWVAPVVGVDALLTCRSGPASRNRTKAWDALCTAEKKMRHEGTARHRLDAWARHFGLEIERFERPTIEIHDHDRAFADEWWARTVTDTKVDGDATRVLVFPGCAWAQRRWPKPYWIDVAGSLKDCGHAVLAMVESDADQKHSGFPFGVWSTTPGQCWAVLAGADVVLSADTGPGHLAATLGKPLVVAQGPTRAEWVFGHAADRVTAVQSARPCTGCDLEKEKGFEDHCLHGCQSLMDLTPRTLLAAALEVCAEAKAERAIA